jgi:hypothetical protein
MGLGDAAPPAAGAHNAQAYASVADRSTPPDNV